VNPQASRSLLVSGEAAQELIGGGYAFTYAAGLVTGGRLRDLFTYRRMFLAGKRLIAAYGPSRPILVGCLAGALSMAVLGGSLLAYGGGIPLALLIVGLSLLGIGNTLILPAVIGATLATVEPQQAGVASGTLSTVQQVSGAAGLAAIGTIFLARLRTGTGTGTGTGRAAYASAAPTVVRVNLGLIAVMAARPKTHA
jgi:MFS family permease